MSPKLKKHATNLLPKASFNRKDLFFDWNYIFAAGAFYTIFNIQLRWSYITSTSITKPVTSPLVISVTFS